MIKKKRQNNFVNCEQPYSNIQKYVALVCLKYIYIYITTYFLLFYMIYMIYDFVFEFPAVSPTKYEDVTFVWKFPMDITLFSDIL